VIAAGLAVLVFAFTRRASGPFAGVLACGLVAFMPDMLGHSGVSHNDVPLALAYFGAAWAIDAAVRRPSWQSVALASFVATLAFGVKFSALSLVAVAVVLIIAEWIHRGSDRRWLGRLGLFLPYATVVSYLTLVLLYRGDFGLADLGQGFAMQIDHATSGHGRPSSSWAAKAKPASGTTFHSRSS